MKIITFQGGLGNQLFEYSFYIWLKGNFPEEKIYGFYPKRGLSAHNGLEINRHFNSCLPKSRIVTNIIVNVLKFYRRITGKTFKISTLEKFHNNDILYEDFWQDMRFIPSNLNIDFKIPSLSEDNKRILNKIRNTESVSVHIRRGDYFIGEQKEIYGGICTVEYYNKAINKINDLTNNPSFFIFSDDIEWVRKNIKLPKDSTYVANNVGDDSFIDMFLMYNCKHNIIANSTFSWWGAYLNKNESKVVIMPKKWFNLKYNEPNIFIESWIKL